MNTQKQFSTLADITLSPYIQAILPLRFVVRKVGGNSFRHSLNSFIILLDYMYIDPILLKACILHDSLEELSFNYISVLNDIDEDSKAVLDLVWEVTKRENENKIDYLLRIKNQGSSNAKLIKSSDRISNLIDLHMYIFDPDYINFYLDQTEKYVLPIAQDVDENMVKELSFLIEKRRAMLKSK